jgi:hypothetical protein
VLIYAMTTVGDVVAEETAVCEAHLGRGEPPLYDDVTDRTLLPCPDHSGLRCRVCGVNRDGQHSLSPAAREVLEGTVRRYLADADERERQREVWQRTAEHCDGQGWSHGYWEHVRRLALERDDLRRRAARTRHTLDVDLYPPR